MNRRIWINVCAVALVATLALVAATTFYASSDRGPSDTRVAGVSPAVATPAEPPIRTAEPAPSEPAAEPASAPAVAFSVIDPELLDSLATGTEKSDGVQAVFLAGPKAQVDPDFLAVAEHLTRLADGLYSGVLRATDVAKLQTVDGLKVSADRVLTVDPPEAPSEAKPEGSAFQHLQLTSTPVTKVDPTLAATRTALNLKGNGQVIAVIDTGIDTHAVGLAGKVAHREDFTPPSANCSDQGFLDPYGHGTHVASIAAGATNSTQPTVEGVAPLARLVDLRVFDCEAYGTTSQVDQALQWVLDNRVTYNITVVNLSLSNSDGNQDGTDTSSILVNRLVASGVFVSVAAGNLGDAPSTVYSPASAQFATTVGSAGVTDYGTYLSPFSSQGPIAGRNGIDMLAAGSSILAANSTAHSSWGQTVVYSGTSMAAPYVAGLAVLLSQKNPSHAPSGTICYDLVACPEGVTTATMTNTLEDDISAGDWFTPGPDPISGRGLVNATNSLKGLSSPAASHVEGALDAGSANLIAVPPHAKAVTVTVITDPPVRDSAFDTLGDFEYARIDAAGVTSPVQFPCNLTVTNFIWCTMGSSSMTPREYYFSFPASAETTWLRIVTAKTVNAVVTAPGLATGLTLSNGIAADDLQLDADGNGTLHVARSLASASPSTLSFSSSAGVLAPADVTLAAGATGTFVDVPISRNVGYTPVSPESAARLTVTSGGEPVAAVSVQYPSSDGADGQVTVDGHQVKLGDLRSGRTFVGSNGTVVGDSNLPSLVRLPSTYGFYTGPFVVEPGSNDAHKIPIDQTTVTPMSVEGLSADGNRVLMRESAPGAGVVPGDDDERAVYFVFDRASGTSTEVGSSALVPVSYPPVMSSDGHSAAFLVQGPNDTVQVYWQGGAGSATAQVVATFPAQHDVKLYGVDATHVLVGVNDPSVGYPESRLYAVAGGSYVAIAPAYVAPALSADGSAVAYATANFTDVNCYRVSDGARVSFDARGEGAWTLWAGDNCTYVAAELARFAPYPQAYGSNGFDLARLFPGGSRTLLAANVDRNISWLSDVSGTKFITVTGLPLSPGDTNGLYDVYRGAYGAPELAPPVISSASPSSGPTGGGTTVTLTGTGFTGATSVTFGGVAGRSVSVASATSLTVVTPAHAGGPVDVVVTTPKGSGPPGVFTYRAVAKIASVSPGFGPTAGGTVATLVGTGFSTASAVTVGGAVASFEIVSDTSLKVTMPAGTAVRAPIIVTNSIGDSLASAPAFFAFTDSSVVAGIPAGVADVANFTAGVVRCYQVTGKAGVPVGAVGVTLNVTASLPNAAGHVRVYPDYLNNGASPAPLVSTVNFEANRDVANSTTISLPTDGKVCAYSVGGTMSRLILDVEAYTLPESGITLITPKKLIDTRPQAWYHAGSINGPVQPMTDYKVQVGGVGSVPADAVAVMVNVTVVDTNYPGHLRMWASDQAMPNTSVVNYAPETKANSQIVALSASGELTFRSFSWVPTTMSPVQVLIDVTGYITAGSDFTATTPTTIVETRPAYTPVGLPAGALTQNKVYPLTLDTSVVPAGATAVVLNVTVVQPTNFGHIRVYPDTNGLGTTPPPIMSNINFIPGRDIPNMVIVQLPPGRTIDFYTAYSGSGHTDLKVDLIGYIGGTPG